MSERRCRDDTGGNAREGLGMRAPYEAMPRARGRRRVEVHHILTPVDRGCGIEREEGDKLGDPSSGGRHDRLNSEPRLQLRKE